MHALIDGTITDFDDGDLVSGTIVQVERDEVLLDIGYKSEGVIPARELSIRKDANPADIVTVGDQIEALVLQKEDKDGRLILSKKRAEYERAWSKIEEKFNSGENVEGEVIEVVKGGLILDIGLRGFLPASLVDLRRVKDLRLPRRRASRRGSSRWTATATTSSSRAAWCSKRAASTSAPRSSASCRRADPAGYRLHHRRLRRLRGPRRHRRPRAHLRAVLEPRQPPVRGRQGRRPGRGQVLDVDMDRERISLGLKQTQDDPWKQLVKDFPVGTISRARSPSSCRSALSSSSATVSRVSCTSPRWPRATSRRPTRSRPSASKVHVKVMDVDLDRRRISLRCAPLPRRSASRSRSPVCRGALRRARTRRGRRRRGRRGR